VSPYQTARSGRPANPSAPAHHAPHAALLIDFDNVTLGIRSDLTKELRTLLNSDIIKGKVAVQRAYADWRRYPQYIVPLSESSIDLIFAPAFGTSKKNATDIRLAIDAIELVFTRPEIGTVILLSGDSDFSALVIKLKEYGKYVIGVGIRESASDLLIQNCDEYYSYSDLAGLTKEEEPSSIQRDPWELVVQATEQMARNKDVMRSDRLKQVMQQIDPNFDEKNAGFNRFSKFVTEAGSRGLIQVTKLDNGQFEVAPPRAAAAVRAEPPITVPAEDGGRGRGRGRGRRGRGREREREAPAAAEAAPTPKAPKTDGRLSLAEAFQLMQRALHELPGPVAHDKLRARMLALVGREDPLLDADRFARLLRQANDAEIADVRKTGDDSYEVAEHRTVVIAKAAQAAATGTHRAAKTEPAESAEAEMQPADVDGGRPGESAAERARRLAAVRFRRGSRGGMRMADVPLVGVVKMEPEKGAPAAADKPSGEKPSGGRRGRRGRRATGQEAAPTATEPPKVEAAPAAAPVEPAKTAKASKKKRSRGAKAAAQPAPEAAAPKEAAVKKRPRRSRKSKAKESPKE